MKFLIVTSTLPSSNEDSVPSFVKDQANWLAKQHGVDISILAPHNSYSDTKSFNVNKFYTEYRFHYFWPFRYEKLTGRGILPALKENSWLYLLVPFLFVAEFFATIKLVRKIKPDLIYAHWFTPQAVICALTSRLTSTPFVFTTHAGDVAVWKKIPFSAWIVRSVCNRARVFTAVSNRTANKLQSFFSEDDWKKRYSDKLSVIPMGVDTTPARVNKKELRNALESLDIPKGKNYILFMGRLTEKKGVPYLLQAFSRLSDDVKETHHLIIAGDGQLISSLKDHAKKLNLKNVTFTGYVSGIRKDALFDLANIVCVPSIIDTSGDSEGFPVVLMEAFAAGKIVLASNTTGAEEIITNGKNGFVFKQKSVGSLIKALNIAFRLNAAQKKQINSGSKKLAEQFDWAKIAKQHYNLFKEKALEDSNR